MLVVGRLGIRFDSNAEYVRLTKVILSSHCLCVNLFLKLKWWKYECRDTLQYTVFFRWKNHILFVHNCNQLKKTEKFHTTIALCRSWSGKEWKIKTGSSQFPESKNGILNSTKITRNLRGNYRIIRSCVVRGLDELRENILRCTDCYPYIIETVLNVFRTSSYRSA